MEKTFSIKKALSFGWTTFKVNPIRWIVFVAGVPILIAAPGEIVGMMSSATNTDEVVALNIAVSIATAIVGIIIQVGIIKIALAAVDGKEWNWRDLYRNYSFALNFLLASILYGLAVFAGLLLLIVPGIIVAIMLNLFQYSIVDKNAGPLEALKQSRAITKGVRVKLFLFALASIGITLLGFLTFIVGLFVAIPVTTIAGAWVYRQLERQTNARGASSSAA